MARNLTIIARTCARVHMLNGQTRYVSCSKRDLINVCLSSLVNSINQVTNHNIKLCVLDDHSDAASLADIKQIVAQCSSPSEVISLEGTGITGASETCKAVYRIVEQECNDLFYHVEDDYLHTPAAIQSMLDSYVKLEEDTGYMIAMNPHDDPWRYTRQIYESIILHGTDRHYRTVKHSTYTCLASRKIYDKYKNHFDDSAQWILKRDENETINKVWNKPDVMMFAPIPTVALHVSAPGTEDPFLSFNDIWRGVPRLWEK